jgi:hypothetical protein
MSNDDAIPPMPQQRERSWATLKQRMMNEPFVPLGCLVTVGFLFRGMRASKNGNRSTASHSMKGRVLAQGFTAVCVMFGIYWKRRQEGFAAMSMEQKIASNSGPTK